MNPWTLPLLCALAIPVVAQKPVQPPRTLAGMRDRYRVLLLFAPPDNAQLAAQLDALKPHRADLLERQVMLVPLHSGGSYVPDPAVETPLPEEGETLRRRFHVRADEFAVILLGKDGGEKFRASEPVTIDRLNGMIDAMPMRRAEMRSQPPR